MKSCRFVVFAALILGAVLLIPARACALSPCCQITAINSTTGVVTAKVNATGQEFQFTLTDAALLRTLKVGQAVYANLTTKQVSLDGQRPIGQITSMGAVPTAKHVGTTSGQQSLGESTNPVAPCCNITAINSTTGVVTGKVNATGQEFQFKVSDAAVLRSLKVGQSIYANLRAKQVSLDGKTPCGTITSIGMKPDVTGRAQSPSDFPIRCLIAALGDPNQRLATAHELNEAGTGGYSFEFKVSPDVYSTLHVGGTLFANMGNLTVSLDGVHAIGQISSQPVPWDVGSYGSAATAGNGSASASKAQVAQVISPNDAKAAPMDGARTGVNSAAPCCDITAINSTTGVVTGKVKATGQQFQFTLINPAQLRSLHVGQTVYANLASKQVSLDGQHPAGQIVSTPPGASISSGYDLSKDASAATAPNAPGKTTGPNTSAAASAPGGQATSRGATQTQPSAASPTARAPKASIQAAKTQAAPLPTLAFGTPQPVTQQVQNAKAVPFLRLGPAPNATVVHLHGLDGIKAATGLPDGVQDFLFLHARQLPPTEVDNYIVNIQLAQQWFQTHPEPDFIKQAATKAMETSCSSSEHCDAISMHCLGQVAEHAKCEANRQNEKLREAWQADWHHWTGQAENLWHEAQGCFSDHTLDPADGSFQFSLTPQFPVSFQKSGQTSNAYGTFSGQISGTATVGVPLEGTFTGQLQMFYIPCLPFATRPKSISGDGTLGVGVTLDATLNASGQFEQSVTVPPNGIKIPVYVIPVVIGGVPVAELDASVYLDGTLKVDGKGTLNGHANLQAHEETAYDFSCNGGGCAAHAHRVSVPDTATESMQVQGRIHLRPAVYAALQLDLDWDILSARSGPEPYLLGEIFGCEYAAGSQSTASAATSQEYHALAADVDWGIALRSEALAGGKEFWHHDWNIPGPDGRPLGGHLLFKPLIPSNALSPAVAGVVQPQINQVAAYSVKMPQCYPYSDQIEYMVQWNGGATQSGLVSAPTGSSANNAPRSSPVAVMANRAPPPTSSPSANCTLQSGQADCWTDPLKDLPFSLDWPAPGNYSVIITPVRDKHGRKFDSGSASQLNVSVQ